MTTQPDNSQRLLEACRYLSGEMSAEKAARFEEKLATSQTMREAISDLVLLNQSLLAGSPPASRSRRPRSFSETRRTSGGLLAVAGSLLAVLVVAVGLLRSPEEGPQTLATRSPDLSAAALWAEISTGQEPFGAAEDEEADEVDAGFDALEVPDWMFAAVEAGAAADEREEFPDLMDHEETL